MKKLLLFILSMIVINQNAILSQSIDSASISEMEVVTVTNELYFGQIPPGDSAVVFAPGIISLNGAIEFGIVFSNDGKEIYFTRREENMEHNVILFTFYKENSWSDINILHAPDNKNITTPYIFPAQLDSIFKNMSIVRPTMTFDSTIYFERRERNMEIDGIYFSQYKNHHYEKPEKLGTMINPGCHPFIAPDESYLIFDSDMREGFGSWDLYISFRCDDGSWTEALNMGSSINTSEGEWYATISPDGKYLFFTKSNSPNQGDIFWINTSIIEELKKKVKK
jgi:hypothetical protein